MILNKKSDFLKNVSILVIGTAIAKVIPILVSPILTRVYSPEDFGFFGVLLSIASIFIFMTTFRLELKIFTENIYKNIENIYNMIFTLLVYLTIPISIVIYLIVMKKYDSNIYIFLFMLIYIFLSSINSIITNFSNKLKLYNLIKNFRILTALTNTSFQLLLPILFTANYSLLIVAMLLSSLFGFIYASKMLKIFKSKIVSLSELKRFIVENKNYPLYSLPQKIMSEFHTYFLVIFISYSYGMQDVGLVVFSIKLLTLPSSIVLSAIASVWIQKLSLIKSKKDRFEYSKKMLKNSFLIATLIYMTIFFLPEELFTFIFSEKWIGLKEKIDMLLLFYFFQFIFHPMINLYYVNEWQKEIFKIELIKTIILSIFLVVGGHYLKLNNLIFTYSLLYAMYYIFLYRNTMRLSR